MRIIDLLTGFVAPAVCDLCGCNLADGETWLCLPCLASLPVMLDDREEIRISRLPRTAPIAAFDTMLAYTRTNHTARLILEGKYGDRPEIIDHLGYMFGERLAAAATLADVDCIVPVAMHWRKRLRRGYNQAEILARAVARATGLPVELNLKAVKPHAVQSRRSASERMHNLDNTLVVPDKRKVAGRHIALIDDILTTGATISEAIRALEVASPRAITVLTLATTKH